MSLTEMIPGRNTYFDPSNSHRSRDRYLRPPRLNLHRLAYRLRRRCLPRHLRSLRLLFYPLLPSPLAPHNRTSTNTPRLQLFGLRHDPRTNFRIRRLRFRKRSRSAATRLGPLASPWALRHNQQRLRVHLYSLCSILEFLAATTAGDGREHELQRIDDVCGDCIWHDILLHMGEGTI